MAIGYPPPNTNNWGRWSPHEPAGAEYNMMEAGMVPYDSRTGTAAPIQRPGPPQPFLPGVFHTASMPSPVSPQYQTPVLCGGYVPYSPPQMLDTQFKPEPYLGRPQLRVLPLTHGISQGVQRSWDGLPSPEKSPSPFIKSESGFSIAGPTTSGSSTSSKNIVPNVRVQGAPVQESKTRVDELVGILQGVQARIQLENGETEQANKRPCARNRSVGTQHGRAKEKHKPFLCNIAGCSKAFAQKNNLETHRRSHTGESPYVCPYVAECGERFTQGINLKTHIRRHTGEKPYSCPQCGKAFPQRSNVKSHMKTHEKRELFYCKLDGCNKAFTAKGNLKTHQNAFHLETVVALIRKFAIISDDSITEEEQELIRYITSVHNNANKGIKGRGKGRKVKRIVLPQPYQQQAHHGTPMPSTSPPSSSPVHANPYPFSLLPHSLPQLHTAQQQQPMHHFHGLSSPAAYSMGRAPNHHNNNNNNNNNSNNSSSSSSSMLFGMGVVAPRDAHGHGYGMHHMDSDMASSPSSCGGGGGGGGGGGSHSQASTPVHQQQQIYEEAQERELMFANRMY
ncbi:hypothetical protein BT67DRAFT_369905 [Trichocladium antarcticum]|uniref:C2H2-type domain-containing protein n=1 Tax=Trichocladium antarcticum TaxID=1450529 RepID=A0AAN6UVR0_9PEZI|nr:hypothetical protein BT67DRAFT_369905 [Trichocladium antarcticum]